jgi:anti-sigma-K factor RskA
MTNSILTDEIKELAAGYVLDELDPDEMAAFEQIMSEHVAVRQEVRELQIALGSLVVDVPQLEPPAHLRAKMLAALGVVDEPVVLPQKKFNWSKLTAIVATIAAAVLLWDNWRLRQDLSLAQLQTTEKVASILQRPNSKLVALTSQTSDAASGTLLFTPGKWQQVVVSAQNLPPLPVEKVYRLWLNLNNNQTIYCGEFQTDGKGSVSRSIQPPQVPPPGTKATGMFVTVEQKDTPLAPTGTRVMSGTI